MNGRTYKAHQKLKSLYDDVKKGLEVDQNEKIYLYCNDKRFSPPLEETFASLYIKFRQKDYFKPKENAYAIYIEYCMRYDMCIYIYIVIYIYICIDIHIYIYI